MGYKLIKQYPDSGLNVGEIFFLPDDRFIFGDENETPCDENYFDEWHEYFEKIDT